MSIPSEAASQFLQLHSGTCSVPMVSIFAKGFAELQEAGEVTISPSGTSGYIDIHSKNFKPRFVNPQDEQ